MKSQRIRSAFTRKISQLTGKYMNWQIWRDFVIMSATSISNSIDLTHFEERNDLYGKTAAQYTPEELSKFVELLVDTVGPFARTVSGASSVYACHHVAA